VEDSEDGVEDSEGGIWCRLDVADAIEVVSSVLDTRSCTISRVVSPRGLGCDVLGILQIHGCYNTHMIVTIQAYNASIQQFSNHYPNPGL
jgi:hypothetical protein